MKVFIPLGIPFASNFVVKVDSFHLHLFIATWYIALATHLFHVDSTFRTWAGVTNWVSLKLNPIRNRILVPIKDIQIRVERFTSLVA